MSHLGLLVALAITLSQAQASAPQQLKTGKPTPREGDFVVHAYAGRDLGQYLKELMEESAAKP